MIYRVYPVLFLCGYIMLIYFLLSFCFLVFDCVLLIQSHVTVKFALRAYLRQYLKKIGRKNYLDRKKPDSYQLNSHILLLKPSFCWCLVCVAVFK